MYLILMMSANFKTGPIASEANVQIWHEADLQHARLVGLPSVALPTFVRVCRFIAAFQTLIRGVAKVGT